MNRVTQWTQGSSQKTYSYDSLGNNIDSSPTGGTYNLDNEELPDTGAACYDAAGNMITLSNGSAGVYDAWGRLVEVDSGSNVVEQFRYDGLGRRVQVLSNFTGGSTATAETRLLPRAAGRRDPLAYRRHVCHGVYTGGMMTGGYQYVWSPLYVNSAILRDTLDASGSASAGERIFYLTDANNNVTAVLQHNGGKTWQVAARYSYDPYGNWTEFYTEPGATRSTTTSSTPVTHLTPPTGLYFDRARYYDPQLGRFISQDPMGTAGSGNNLYAYCGDNPTDGVDPTGLFKISIAFDAFIPSGLGVTIHGMAAVNADLANVNWGLAPFQLPLQSRYTYFETDNRNFAGQAGTSRLHLDGGFDSTRIGSLQALNGTLFNAYCDPSYQLQADNGGLLGPSYVPGTLKKKVRRIRRGRTAKIDVTADGSFIEADASAADPLVSHAPSINEHLEICARLADGSVSLGNVRHAHRLPRVRDHR